MCIRLILSASEPGMCVLVGSIPDARDRAGLMAAVEAMPLVQQPQVLISCLFFNFQNNYH